MPLIPTLGRPRQTDLCEIKNRHLYRLNSKSSQDCIVRILSQKTITRIIINQHKDGSWTWTVKWKRRMDFRKTLCHHFLAFWLRSSVATLYTEPAAGIWQSSCLDTPWCRTQASPIGIKFSDLESGYPLLLWESQAWGICLLCSMFHLYSSGISINTQGEDFPVFLQFGRKCLSSPKPRSHLAFCLHQWFLPGTWK